MGDELEGTNDGLSEATEATIQEGLAEASSGPEGGGINPAWESIREKLGDNHFAIIRDELSKFDRAAESRIANVNSQLSEYKKLGEPAAIQNAMTIAQRLDADPETMYNLLGDFLQRTGRMPNKQETEQLAEQAAEEGADEQQPQEDPRFAQLQQQQEQIAAFLQEQQREAEIARESQVLEQELAELKQKGYSQEDLQAIYQFTVQIAEQRHRSGDRTPVSLNDGAAQFDALRTRILSAPRPGDSAPKLLPTSGGSPNGSQQRSMGQLSKNETVDLVAARLGGGQ